MPNRFEQRCEETAGRFLLTVVVVDDGAYLEPEVGQTGTLTVPDRRTAGAEVELPLGTRTTESLDARAVVEGFSRVGLICSVVAPKTSGQVEEIALSAVRRADIVVLDWRLSDDGEATLGLVKSIAESDAGESLRLIAIYTGSQKLREIMTRVAEVLRGVGLECPEQEIGTGLECGSLRIVIYAKDGVTLEKELQQRSVPEKEVARVLVREFGGMVSGLVPNLALRTLTAVRENTHRLIEKFHSGLDPAYVTHVACLGSPEDAQQHMVAQVASELEAIMGDAAVDAEPVGLAAIKEWLDARLGTNAGVDCGGGRECTREEILGLLKNGWDRGRPKKLGRKDGFRHLTTGFSKGEDSAQELDRELAWIMCCRTVVNAPAPILQMGSVVQAATRENEAIFLCLKPKCDSVRLAGRTTFLLLRLVVPEADVAQLVVRTDPGEFKRVSVAMGMDDWMLKQFEPSEKGKAVVALRDDREFYFVDWKGARFRWLGELRDELAQQIAQRFALGLARIPVNNSEWLRREERRDG